MLPVLSTGAGMAQYRIIPREPQIQIVVFARAKMLTKSTHSFDNSATVDDCAVHSDRIAAQKRCEGIPRHRFERYVRAPAVTGFNDLVSAVSESGGRVGTNGLQSAGERAWD